MVPSHPALGSITTRMRNLLEESQAAQASYLSLRHKGEIQFLLRNQSDRPMYDGNVRLGDNNSEVIITAVKIVVIIRLPKGHPGVLRPLRPTYVTVQAAALRGQERRCQTLNMAACSTHTAGRVGPSRRDVEVVLLDFLYSLLFFFFLFYDGSCKNAYLNEYTEICKNCTFALLQLQYKNLSTSKRLRVPKKGASDRK